MVNETNTNELSLKLQSSPFHLEEDWFIICENKNKNCSQKEIDVLIAKEIINYIDLEIMRLLCRFGFINTYNIGYALSYTLPSGYKKSSYQRNIQKMVRAGILLKYSIRTGNTVDDAYASPMRFYALSAGARAYIEPHIDIPFSNKLVLSAYDIINCLAVSQLLIHFLKDHGSDYIVSCRTIIKCKGYKSIILDGLIQFNKPTYFSVPTQIALISIRDSAESYAHASDRLMDTFHVFKEKYSKSDLIIIIITESVSSIKAITEVIMLDERMDGVVCPYYYTTDSLLHTDPLFESLFAVTFESKDNVVVIKRIHLIPQ